MLFFFKQINKCVASHAYLCLHTLNLLIVTIKWNQDVASAWKIHSKWRDAIHYESKSFEDILKASFYIVLCLKILNWRIKAYPQACKKGIKSIRWRMFTHFIFDTYIRGFQLVMCFDDRRHRFPINVWIGATPLML